MLLSIAKRLLSLLLSVFAGSFVLLPLASQAGDSENNAQQFEEAGRWEKPEMSFEEKLLATLANDWRILARNTATYWPFSADGRTVVVHS